VVRIEHDEHKNLGADQQPDVHAFVLTTTIEPDAGNRDRGSTAGTTFVMGGSLTTI